MEAETVLLRSSNYKHNTATSTIKSVVPKLGNFTMNLEETEWISAGWISQFQNRDKWRALVGKVNKSSISRKCRKIA